VSVQDRRVDHRVAADPIDVTDRFETAAWLVASGNSDLPAVVPLGAARVREIEIVNAVR